MYSVNLRDLQHMSAEDRDRALSEFTARAQQPRNGQAAFIGARIRTFEQRYEMTSEQLRVALREGHQRETAEISSWLFWLEAQAAVAR